MRISPKASEKPEERRNNRPPKATLFNVWMIQNCMNSPSFRPGAVARGPESITTGGSVWHGRSNLCELRGYGFRARGLLAPRPGMTRQLLQILRRRKVTREHRLLQECFLRIGPELA